MKQSPRPIPKFKPRYDAQRLVADCAGRGWQPADLARAAGVSRARVSLFLSGRRQTARTADALARALGLRPSRYLLAVERRGR
jgi:transcriptional regulator with XRE-family HTH domain